MIRRGIRSRLAAQIGGSARVYEVLGTITSREARYVGLQIPIDSARKPELGS